MKKVIAKFNCHTVEEQEFSKTAKLSAVYSDKGENKDFTESTPSGNFEIMITKSAPASEFFHPGKDYYIEFSVAPKE